MLARFTMTARHDNYDGRIYILSWGDTRIDCISGTPGSEPIHPERDWPGSLRPIPEGVYKIEKPVKEPVATSDPAIGPDWIALTPLTNISGRNAFLIHRDWNYAVSPGTAGCPAPVRHIDMLPIVEATNKGEIEYLAVDYGYGTIDAALKRLNLE